MFLSDVVSQVNLQFLHEMLLATFIMASKRCYKEISQIYHDIEWLLVIYFQHL